MVNRRRTDSKKKKSKKKSKGGHRILLLVKGHAGGALKSCLCELAELEFLMKNAKWLITKN